ncbi:hypothetical protein [Streptomyces sp. NPDC056045]|uniref:hypothetical protein n=1 Tax=Streptomyces sp. NPDC056045 TaxID=3345691 RepID=UPI0035D59B24
MDDLLASIDDVLSAAPAAPAVPAARVEPVAPVAPVAAVEPVERRSTVTEVEYDRVGPAISERLKKRPPLAVPPVPDVPLVDVSAPAEPEPGPVVSAESAGAEAAVEEPEEEAGPVRWWRMKRDDPEPEAEPSAEAVAIENAVAAGIAAGVAAAGNGGAPEAAGEPEPKDRWRWLLYNGTAAAAGHLTVWAVAGDPMAGAHYVARMAVSVPQVTAAALTVGAAYVGWRAGGLLKGLPGPVGLVARPVGALGAALWGSGSAPLVQTGLDSLGSWGTLLSPLLAVAPLTAACWYGPDRMAARAHLIRPVRWLARVPVATVVVSSLLYTSGALL